MVRRYLIEKNLLLKKADIRDIDLLVKIRKIEHISLEATEMGRPQYERYGFAAIRDEMELCEKAPEKYKLHF